MVTNYGDALSAVEITSLTWCNGPRAPTSSPFYNRNRNISQWMYFTLFLYVMNYL